MAVARSTEALLRWSWWRRWHQAWARLYHYRRRTDAAPAPGHTSGPRAMPAAARPSAGEAAPPGATDATAPSSDVADRVWRQLEPLLAPAQRGGRPWTHDRRVVFDAIVHVMHTDCGWRALPSHFPPWQTVYAQFAQWRKTGIWATIWSRIEPPCPTEQIQL